jgi:hypothetical protein
MMIVVKVRGSDHSKDLRLYEVHSDGLTIGDRTALYDHGLLTADPMRAANASRSPDPSRRDRPRNS